MTATLRGVYGEGVKQAAVYCNKYSSAGGSYGYRGEQPSITSRTRRRQVREHKSKECLRDIG